MKIINSDLKKGELKLKVENLDDMWYLNQIIETNDIVKGKTLRKIKIGKEGDRSQKTVKKSVFLSIAVEKVEFSKFSSILRVSGIVKQGPEDIPLGSYHTFNIEENTVITITKQKWLKFQLDKIKEASKETAKILICIHDREEAYFALMKKYGYQILSNIKGTVTKKADLKKVETTFYKDIAKQLEEYDKRYSLNKIIIASPAFWKEELIKEINEDIKKKTILATCSSVSENAINEVLKRPETEQALKQDRISKEYKYVEELFQEIQKNNLASYGIKETKNAAEAGAVRVLLITDKFIQKKRTENKYQGIEEIMKHIDNSKGDIFIISSDHEAGKKMDGLGGIGAILRYKINY
ncbi:MAG: mRNA surveillance protein pelota [Candidatus Woesearchaeota archaeon]|jgi:protein pelota|nr:mRNA surveillance protein pelota [Candidatus Woesearchaeota archaeon]|tara:strand:+ start:1344 stop:2402 length:1059 start_codon:yes stop_codon:yes gene_type:complete